jgi:hypothetical protein
MANRNPAKIRRVVEVHGGYADDNVVWKPDVKMFQGEEYVCLRKLPPLMKFLGIKGKLANCYILQHLQDLRNEALDDHWRKERAKEVDPLDDKPKSPANRKRQRSLKRTMSMVTNMPKTITIDVQGKPVKMLTSSDRGHVVWVKLDESILDFLALCAHAHAPIQKYARAHAQHCVDRQRFPKVYWRESTSGLSVRYYKKNTDDGTGMWQTKTKTVRSDCDNKSRELFDEACEELSEYFTVHHTSPPESEEDDEALEDDDGTLKAEDGDGTPKAADGDGDDDEKEAGGEDEDAEKDDEDEYEDEDEDADEDEDEDEDDDDDDDDDDGEDTSEETMEETSHDDDDDKEKREQKINEESEGTYDDHDSEKNKENADRDQAGAAPCVAMAEDDAQGND